MRSSVWQSSKTVEFTFKSYKLFSVNISFVTVAVYYCAGTVTNVARECEENCKEERKITGYVATTKGLPCNTTR